MYSADLVPGEIPDDTNYTMDVDENYSDYNDDIYEETVGNTDDMTVCFIAWIVGFSVEPELQYKVSIPRDKCARLLR